MGIEQVIIVVHVLIALAIIGLILLQQGKGAEMGASFGAGSSQTMFGAAGGGNVLTKATALLAALFFVTSFALALVAKNHAGGMVDVAVPAVIQGEVPEAEGVPSGDVPLPEAGDAGSEVEIPGVD